ncbi:hypothetical protein V5799_011375 [Amblyomma americanum]|uniref:Uncharacterized protein n=1 Tax=Amblyomma americanum TaxID=6943 RepID=A0AAQ4EI31_AMBAM
MTFVEPYICLLSKLQTRGPHEPPYREGVSSKARCHPFPVHNGSFPCIMKQVERAIRSARECFLCHFYRRQLHQQESDRKACRSIGFESERKP